MKLVRYVGEKSCNDAAYHAALGDGSVVVDTCPRKPNVVIRFTSNDKPILVPLPALYRDLLDLAASVYIADELVNRKSAEDGWSRSFDFLFPVRAPAVWEPTTDLLEQCLGGLSGDQFTFEWVERAGIPQFPKSRQKLRRNDYEVACLFSGGIDSLLGAWQLLSAGRRVVLIGHQADGLTARAQTDLVAALSKLFPGMLTLVQTRVSRAGTDRVRYRLPIKVEETHRPRSFLFLSLATCIAAATGAKELHIPENGLIALNPPLQVCRRGTLSTRTAHPVYLTRFRNLLHTLGAFRGPLRNPFIYLSKTDMLRDVDPRLHPLLMRSVSCARPSRYQDRGVRHCGYCVPCLFRRVAMAGPGLDQSADYAFDVFRDLSSMTATTSADFRALVPFAARVAQSKNSTLESLVLSHGAFSPSVGGELGPTPATDYSPWTGMLKRWSEDFLDFTDRRATDEVKRAINFQPRRGRSA